MNFASGRMYIVCLTVLKLFLLEYVETTVVC